MNETISTNQIIIEHRHPALLQLSQREHLKFDIHSDHWSQIVGKLLDGMIIQAGIDKIRRGNKDIEFQVIVWLFSSIRIQDSSFSTAVSSAEKQTFYAPGWNDLKDLGTSSLAEIRKARFERVSPGNCKSLVHSAK